MVTEWQWNIYYLLLVIIYMVTEWQWNIWAQNGILLKRRLRIQKNTMINISD